MALKKNQYVLKQKALVLGNKCWIKRRELLCSSLAPPTAKSPPANLGLLRCLSICLSAAVCGALCPARVEGPRRVDGRLGAQEPHSWEWRSPHIAIKCLKQSCKVASRGKTQRMCVFNVTAQSLALSYYYYILLAKLSNEWWRQKVLWVPEERGLGIGRQGGLDGGGTLPAGQLR